MTAASVFDLGVTDAAWSALGFVVGFVSAFIICHIISRRSRT